KKLKGQSQKAQQAVLEKFRLGGYNVIVATSIGEEGLDIMEVDLVICFDANISPLRMIQRMGRTGRKHDGRVDILDYFPFLMGPSCEGTELKGYKRKKATSKTVGKHMRNGGMNSFTFHCSPRMVPHLLKPELLFVELSIEKFIRVRHAKKAKLDSPQKPKFKEKVTDAEASLLEKYFLTSEATKPSLVAFPSFQTCPSRVHKVMHSSRTGWLIDAMQLLQGLSSSNMSEKYGLELMISNYCADVLNPVNMSTAHNEISNSELSPSGPYVAEEKYLLDSPDGLLDNMVPPAISPSNKHTLPDSSIQDACEVYSSIPDTVGDSTIVHAPPLDETCLNEDIGCDKIDATEPKSPSMPAAECNLNIANSDLSPRLTNFIESGFVPESPLSNASLMSFGTLLSVGEDVTLTEKDGDAVDWKSGAEKDENLAPELISTPEPCANLLSIASKVTVISSPQTKEIESPFRNEKSVEGQPDGLSKIGGISQSPSPEFRTPLQNLTNTSCSEDWRMSSGKISGSSERSFRLKRLRRIGDLTSERRKKSVKEKSTNSSGAFEAPNKLPKVIMRRKVSKQFDDARDFIDGEAEVSSDDVVPDSENDDDYEDSDAYEESFIDDQSDPAVGSGQTEDSKMDMMAIYRYSLKALRSLLTQSPFQVQQKHSRVITPESVPSVTTARESGECLGKTSPEGCLKSLNVSTKNSVDSCLNKIPCEAIPSSSSNALVNVVKTESWRRKLTYRRACFLPPKNLEKEFSSDPALPTKEAPSSHQPNSAVDAGCSSFSDDQFYEGLDLDELEAQAAKLLSQRTGSSTQRKIPEPSPQNTTIMSSPSFDLGIL
ncbi:DEAD-box ATP-dependent RNA helicase FANCM, partial [Bienertia sinuspersici]